MYTAEDVIQKVDDIVSLSKGTLKNQIRLSLNSQRAKQKKEEDDKNEYPDYYSFYKKACEMRDRIRCHAEESPFPEKLFRTRAPRMNDDEFSYMRDNFKQTTLPVFLDFKSTVDRIFNDTSWSCSYNEKAKNDKSAGFTFYQYCNELVPEYGSLEYFMKAYLPHIKLTDACGCIAIRPKEYPTQADGQEYDEQDPQAAKTISSATAYKPMPIYFRCDQLVSFESGEFFLFESDKKSEVEYNGKKQMIGRTFEFYDKNQIMFIKQIGKYTDYEFQADVMPAHNWDRIPVEFLKGVPKITKEGTMWVSPFFYAVDLLDLALLNEANLQASFNSCVYPYRIIEGNECDFEYEDRDGNKIACSDGKIEDLLMQKSFDCPRCGGSGLKANMSPLGVMIIKQSTSLDPTGGINSRMRDPVMFVSPPPDPLDLLIKKIDRDEMKARRILHLSTSSSDVQPNDQQKLATGMVLDLKALYAFLKSIADQIFDLFTFMHEATAMFIYGADKYEDYLPEIAYPVSYDFKTEGDYLSEISAATDTNLPPFVIHTIIYRYISALFFNDKRTAAVFLLLVATDRILIFSKDEVDNKRANGLVEDWEKILHDSGLSLIDQLSSENKDFFDEKKNPFDKRKEQLKDRAKQIAATIEDSRKIKAQADAKANADAIIGGMNQLQKAG